MAVPRPVLLLAVIGTALLAATFYAVRGAHQASVESPPIPKAPAAVSPTTKHKAAPAKHHAAPAKHAAAPAKHHAAPAKHHAAATSHKPSAPPRASAPKAGAAVGLPQDVAKALAERHVVVLFFFQPGAADDHATAASVAALRHQGGRLSVFTAPVTRLSDYRRLVNGLDITSVPSTVIVGRDRKARVLEGFLDGRTLAQEVADSGR
jgi:hypothetical protein